MSEHTPNLREEYVRRACEVFYAAFDQANPDMAAYRASGGKHTDTWTSLTESERTVALIAMDELIGWMDARRI